MTESERIADQMRRAIEGEAWHGPSLGEILEGVNAKQAAAKPIAAAHSIWELTLHCAVWANAARRRMGGERVKITPQEDWAAIRETSEAAWQRDRERSMADLRGFADAIAKFDDARLFDKVLNQEGKPYSIWFMLHGVVQHTLYHAGQIALLKKAVASDK
ncbi:MAG: DinB family protein [Candidatus Acidiferrales bacterium]